MSNFEMNNNNSDSYEEIFAEWSLRPILDEDNYEDSVTARFQEELNEEEEEVFPTSFSSDPEPTVSSRVDEVVDVKSEPVKIGAAVDVKNIPKKIKELPPLPPGIENMMGSILKMFGGELGIDGNNKNDPVQEDNDDDSISKIELKALGRVLKLLALTLFGFFGWIMNKVKDRLPLSHAFDSVTKIIYDDINRGMWNDMFNTPDEFLEYQFPSVVYEALDSMFSFIYFVLDNNRLFVPLATFLVGYWMA